jgi:hypothetical protein
MGSYAEHQRILSKAILRFSESFPDGMIFQRHTGKFLKMSFYEALKATYPDLHGMLSIIRSYKQHWIAISIPGQADSYLMLPLKPPGYDGILTVHIEVEVKSGDAVQTQDQKNWQKAVEMAGGLYILVRHEDDIVYAIKKKWPWIS